MIDSTVRPAEGVHLSVTADVMARGLSASAAIEAAVRDAMTAERVSPRDRLRVAQMVNEAVDRHQRVAAAGGTIHLVDPASTALRVTDAICALGVLGDIVAPGTKVEDVFLEGDRVTYLAEGRLRTPSAATTEVSNLNAVRQLLALTDATLDRAHPIVRGVQVLGGRARLAAAIPPAAPHLSATIRLYVERFAELDQLVQRDTLSVAAANLLGLVVRSKGSILISGETGAGKTTILAALLGQVRPNHCVRLMEEFPEVQFRPVHGGRTQCVPPGPDGSGEVTLAELLKLALRMRPDLCVVGEVLGEESWHLARASRVGAGFMATIHANSAADALEALVLTALEAGPNISAAHIRQTFGRSIDLVVHAERDDPNLVAEGAPYLHQVTEIRAVTPALSPDQFSSEMLFGRSRLGEPMTWASTQPPAALAHRLERLLPERVTLQDVLTGRWGGED